MKYVHLRTVCIEPVIERTYEGNQWMQYLILVNTDAIESRLVSDNPY